VVKCQATITERRVGGVTPDFFVRCMNSLLVELTSYEKIDEEIRAVAKSNQDSQIQNKTNRQVIEM